MRLPLASDYIPQKLRAIPKQVRVAMLSALLVGLACHIQPLTQQLINHDTVTLLGVNGLWLTSQGKWFFGFLGWLRGNISTGGIETALALLILAIVAGMTTSILRVKRTVHAGLLGAMIVAFPSVFCNMLYYCEDTFYAALALATLAVYVTTKYKYGFIGGTILLTFSVGTYQTYIGFAAGLFVIVILLDILENEKKIKNILLDGLKYIAVMLAALVLYYVCLQIMLAIFNMQLSDYMGVSSMGKSSVKGILTQAWMAYRDSLRFMLFDEFGTKRRLIVWSYRFIVLANVVLCALIANKKKLYNSVILSLLVVVLGVIALPLAVHAVAVFTQMSSHWLMKYPFVLMFVLMIALLERFMTLCGDEKTQEKSRSNAKRNLVSGVQWLTIALAAALIFNWFILANQCYQKMRYVKEAVYAKTSMLVHDVLETEEYSENVPVAFIGNTPYKYFKDPKNEFNVYQAFTGFDDTENVFYTSNIMLLFMRNYLGVTFNSVDGAVFEQQHSEEVDDMNVYPSKDSIRSIDGVLVVKMGETAD